MDIAILLYDGFTALDAVGPYEVLHLAPDARVKFVSARPGLVQTDFRQLSLNADYAIEDLPRPGTRPRRTCFGSSRERWRKGRVIRLFATSRSVPSAARSSTRGSRVSETG